MSEVPGHRNSGQTASADFSLSWLWHKLRGLLGVRNGDSQLREAIEEIIVEVEDQAPELDDTGPIGSHEKILLSNLLKLRHVTAHDVMVPRADIVSIDIA